MNDTLNMKEQVIWEEKNSTEQLKKLESKEIFVPNDGISEINNVSVKNECEDTGKKKIWKKNCLKCGKEQSYKSMEQSIVFQAPTALASV